MALEIAVDRASRRRKHHRPIPIDRSGRDGLGGCARRKNGGDSQRGGLRLWHGRPVLSISDAENHGRAARATATATATIGFIGRLDPIKRIPDLLQAVAMLDAGFRLEIFGEGKDRPRIESEIARLHLQSRAILHGAIARPNEALHSTDVLVLPSAAEGFGLVLIEAMAAGVPVVATDVPGIRDVVRNEVTGLLVPVASPIKLAEAIRRVFDEVALRDRLTAAARIEVQSRFSWAVVLPQYIQLLLRV